MDKVQHWLMWEETWVSPSSKTMILSKAKTWMWKNHPVKSHISVWLRISVYKWFEYAKLIETSSTRLTLEYLGTQQISAFLGQLTFSVKMLQIKFLFIMCKITGKNPNCVHLGISVVRHCTFVLFCGWAFAVFKLHLRSLALHFLLRFFLLPAHTFQMQAFQIYSRL